MISRRRFLKNSALLGGYAALQSLMLPAWARSANANNMAGLPSLSGNEFDLHVRQHDIEIDGRKGNAVTVNGQLPAPLLRWREGDNLLLRVTNHLQEDTSIHWHGILLPFQMDGVPGVNFPGIKPGETFEYRFPLMQAGTYWYHSHSGLQEQSGHYGPIIIDPKGADPVSYDREYIILLSDWTFENPHHLFSNLKKMSDFYNFRHPTLGEFIERAKRDGLGAAIDERAMWGDMRMMDTDIADVTGATYTYLLNGHTSLDNWTALYTPGEKVRLRFINASAMSFFNVRIPGLPMTVVQADGLNVQPVETDEFQIGVAETYDVVIEPHHGMAFTLMCESIDRSGFVHATIAPREGMSAEVPALREPPTLTMRDMGMDHGGLDHGSMAHGSSSGESALMDHASHGQAAPAVESGHAGHGAMSQNRHSGHGSRASEAERVAPIDTATHPQTHNHGEGVGVAGVAEVTGSRLHEAGIGLENVTHRALNYTQLKSLEPNPDTRPPERELEIHLTGNMERYMWSFDGLKFSEVDEPIVFQKDERLRLTLVNDTMMPHPIHLHGMFFDVVNGQTGHKPRKHTIIVKPAEKLSVDITADAVGDWAFHCHLIYHMHAGMMQVVSVKDSSPMQHHHPMAHDAHARGDE